MFTKGHLVKKQNQSGSRHLILIIILVVALCGTLGYIYWLKFMQPIKTVSPSTDIVVEDKYFAIDEWGIKGVWNEDYGIKYKNSTYNGTIPARSFDFSTDNMTASCADFPIGSISRFSADDHVGDVHSDMTAGEYYAVDRADGSSGEKYGGNKKIGEYYYAWGYGVASNGCYQSGSTTIDAAYIQASSKMHEFFSSLQGI